MNEIIKNIEYNPMTELCRSYNNKKGLWYEVILRAV